MNLKIQCACGTKFSFDVEPVDGKMPVEIFCPKCGVDVTGEANASIDQSRAGEGPIAVQVAAKPRVRLHVATPAVPETSASASAMPGVEMCFRHPRNVATAHCAVCQKPICPDCMQSFGYLCSINCRYRAEQEKIRVPVYKLQKNVAERGALRKAMAITGVVALVLCALAGVWLWYIFSGSKPRPFYTLKLPADKQGTSARFFGPNQILLLNKNEISAHDIKAKKNVWSTPLNDPLPAPAPGPVAAKGSPKNSSRVNPANEADSEPDNNFSSAVTAPFFTGDEVWICLSHNVVCIDLKSGGVKHTIPFQGRLSAFTPGESTLLVVSDKTPTKKSVTQITPGSGETKTTQVASSLREKLPAAKELPANVLPTAALLLKYELEGAEKSHPSIYKFSSEFFPAGRNLVEMQVKLLEPKVVAVQTMKPAGPSQLNSSTTSSTSARAVQEEILNEQKRNTTGGFKRIDQSRYGVLLRRTMETGALDWTGEVIGVPTFFPEKTVDVLIAGKSLLAFDKQNKKIFDSQLSYPIADKFTAGDRGAGSPCVETNNTLLVFDKGVLTAFELPGGTVRWRLTSVGISAIQFDEKGMLYVNTTTASPEDIQYSEEIKIRDAIQPIILKVDPQGKTLWKSEQIGGRCFLTGKFVYVTDAARADFSLLLAVEEAFGATSRSSGNLTVYRLDPANGKKLWSFTKSGAPSDADFSNNRILLRYSDEIEILKFISF